jgi:protein TonB
VAPTPAPQPVAEPAAAPATVAAAQPTADPGPPSATRGTPGADLDAVAGGGSPGPTPDYLGVLRAWLERHKEYPRPARTRREEGTVLLRFVMERSGRVLSYRIERSSGHPALDRAVEEMLARAQPLPAMPPEIRQARLELVVPVQFALR